jgi:hypothetical protein
MNFCRAFCVVRNEACYQPESQSNNRRTTNPSVLLFLCSPRLFLNPLRIPLLLTTTQKFILQLPSSASFRSFGLPFPPRLFHELVVLTPSFLGLSTSRVGRMGIWQGLDELIIVVRMSPDTPRRMSTRVYVEVMTRLSTA